MCGIRSIVSRIMSDWYGWYGGRGGWSVYHGGSIEFNDLRMRFVVDEMWIRDR